MVKTQKLGQGDRPTGYTRNCKQQYFELLIATLNVDTMRGQSTEIVEMFSIVCIGVSTPLKNTIKSANCPWPPFRQSPYILVFHDSLLKIRFLREIQKY